MEETSLNLADDLWMNQDTARSIIYAFGWPKHVSRSDRNKAEGMYLVKGDDSMRSEILNLQVKRR